MSYGAWYLKTHEQIQTEIDRQFTKANQAVVNAIRASDVEQVRAFTLKAALHRARAEALLWAREGNPDTPNY
jgi:hypothetical protein